jgi:hypothetical protein
MWELLDPSRCATTAEAVLIHGANGTCEEGRHDGDLGIAIAAVLAVAVIVAVVLARAPRYAGRILLGTALLTALPGAYALAFVRADRPTARATTAIEAMRLSEAMRAFVDEHGCARVTVDRCESCLPAARLALTGRTCEDGARIELHRDALARGCTRDGDRLVCGAPR